MSAVKENISDQSAALNISAENKPAEWKAYLDLGFTYKNKRTVLARRLHYGPLVVQRPFYPENDICHVYLIHPPGGVVGGDQLKINVELEKESHVLLTTPSAGKFYRCENLKGTQTQKLKVADQGLLEWFPQENIFFDGCRSEIETIIELTNDAMFCGWEINCLGRPAANEKFIVGSITQRLQLYRDNKPLFLERNEIAGANEILYSRCGFNGQAVFATMLATNINKECCDKLQSIWHVDKDKKISVSLIADVLICRYLGESAEDAKAAFTDIWSVIRMKQKNIKTCKPRIWST